jgi:hypothetical protein
MHSRANHHELIERAHQILRDTDTILMPEKPIDVVEQWRRQGNEATAARVAAKEALRAEERAIQREAAETHTQAWQAYFERRLEERISVLVEATGDAIGQIRAGLRREITSQARDLIDRVHQLQAEIDALKSGKVLPFKGRDDAA